MVIEHPSLQSFLFCPACGKKTLSMPSRKSVSCEECAFEFFFNAAAATGVFIMNHKREALFVRRMKEPQKGKLGVPGGFADAFETLEDAAVREVQEETGLILDRNRLCYLFSACNLYPYKTVEYCSSDVYFLYETDHLDSACPCDETSEIVIKKIDELNENEIAFQSLKTALLRLKTTLKNTKRHN